MVVGPCYITGLDLFGPLRLSGLPLFRTRVSVYLRADQRTGGALLDFSGRTAMHGKSRVSSGIT